MAFAPRLKAAEALADALNEDHRKVDVKERPDGFTYSFGRDGAPVIGTKSTADARTGERTSQVGVSVLSDGVNYIKTWPLGADGKLGEPTITKLGADGKPVKDYDPTKPAEKALLDKAFKGFEVNTTTKEFQSPALQGVIDNSFDAVPGKGYTKAAALDAKQQPRFSAPSATA